MVDLTKAYRRVSAIVNGSKIPLDDYLDLQEARDRLSEIKSSRVWLNKFKIHCIPTAIAGILTPCW